MPDTKKKPLKQQSVDITERVGRLFRATTDAYVEVATGAVETAADTATRMAKMAGETLSDVVSNSAKVTQRGVEKFFDVLSPETEFEESAPGSAGAKGTAPSKSPV